MPYLLVACGLWESWHDCKNQILVLSFTTKQIIDFTLLHLFILNELICNLSWHVLSSRWRISHYFDDNPRTWSSISTSTCSTSSESIFNLYISHSCPFWVKWLMVQCMIWRAYRTCREKLFTFDEKNKHSIEKGWSSACQGSTTVDFGTLHQTYVNRSVEEQLPPRRMPTVFFLLHFFFPSFSHKNASRPIVFASLLSPHQFAADPPKLPFLRLMTISCSNHSPRLTPAEGKTIIFCIMASCSSLSPPSLLSWSLRDQFYNISWSKGITDDVLITLTWGMQMIVDVVTLLITKLLSITVIDCICCRYKNSRWSSDLIVIVLLSFFFALLT